MDAIEGIYIEPKEVLRCLGYRGQTLDEQTRSLISDCIDESHTLVRPKTHYLLFSLAGPSLSLLGTDLSLPGRDIARHLTGCEQCVLMAATLGIAMDNRLHVLQSSDMTRAVVMEAVASVYIEALCDMLEAEIRQKMEKKGYGLTGRFSPGYGDFPLSWQPRFLQLLDAGRKVGLYCSETYMMTPRKSVTAVLGVLKTPKKQNGKKNCDDCQLRGECPYERER